MASDKDRASPLGTRYVERFLRRTFGLAGPTVADHVRGDVSPSIDVRPIHPWEWRDFGILPWAITETGVGAPAEFSFVQVAAPSTPHDLLVLGLLTPTTNAIIRQSVTTQGGTAGNSFVRDIGMFPAWNASAGLFDVRAGSTGVLQGTPVGITGTGNVEYSGRVWILRSGAAAFLSVFNGTANTALTLDAWGLLIPSNVSIL